MIVILMLEQLINMYIFTRKRILGVVLRAGDWLDNHGLGYTFFGLVRSFARTKQ
jgi:hypothetical protein